MIRRQRGFTLAELTIVVVIFGLMITASGPVISMVMTFWEGSKRSEQVVNNQKLASAIMSFARNSNGGRLPAPYSGSGSGIASGLYNPADATALGQALAMELRNTGVPVDQINNDSAVIENVRVYRRVAGLTYSMPFRFSTGSQVTLTYDVGAITSTQCAKANACNTGTPGSSAALTAANITTWEPTAPDYGAIVFSSLPEQKNMLAITGGRINRLQEKLVNEFHTRMRLAAANSTINYFPVPNGAGAPNLSGQNPVVNMGCHDGWYRLSAANVNVLAQLGLDSAEFGVTAWGGPVDYCRDFEPTAVNTSTANTSPHYSALRFNRNLSAASASSGVFANDVVVTF